MQAFRLSFGEVAVSLDLPLDVLELGFELLLGLDTLHEHDFVVLVHLLQLVVHVFEGHVVILLVQVGCHVLFDELAPGDKVLVLLTHLLKIKLSK